MFEYMLVPKGGVMAQTTKKTVSWASQVCRIPDPCPCLSPCYWVGLPALGAAPPKDKKALGQIAEQGGRVLNNPQKSVGERT
ncbi:MAG: hypothetical protein [Caudoviricetes sp.]|nr:MAG: hypothetical protein [Caudoviricetes sp.]